MQPLESAILRTVAYFDLFRYPLTSWELWKWLPRSNATYASVLEALATSSTLRDALKEQAGFFVLRGQGVHISTRQERYTIALRKFAIARRAARIMRCVPFVRAVAVCNNLGLSNATAGSDIDVLIIIRAGRLWFSRMLVTAAVHVLRLRRHHAVITNRLCLSFYVTDAPHGLAFASLRMQPEDPYFDAWFQSLVPVFDSAETFAKLHAANPWCREAFPNGAPVRAAHGRALDRAYAAHLLRTFGEQLTSNGFGRFLDRLARWFQLRLIHSRKASKLWAGGTEVVVNDDMLKFHENDRRRQYAQSLDARLRSIGV